MKPVQYEFSPNISSRFRALCREQVHETIVFFGSARITPDGPLGRYYREARELARMITAWSQSLQSQAHRYVICSGGGPGIMEAANRGAADAGGRSIGLNIWLPHEQRPNPYITRSAILRVSLLLHAQAVVRASCPGAGSFSRWFRHARRNGGDSNAEANARNWIARSSCCSTARNTGKRSSISTRWCGMA